MKGICRVLAGSAALILIGRMAFLGILAGLAIVDKFLRAVFGAGY